MSSDDESDESDEYGTPVRIPSRPYVLDVPAPRVGSHSSTQVPLTESDEYGTPMGSQGSEYPLSLTGLNTPPKIVRTTGRLLEPEPEPEPEPESDPLLGSTGVCGNIDESLRDNFCDSLGNDYEFTRDSSQLCYTEEGCSAKDCCRPKRLELSLRYESGDPVYFMIKDTYKWYPGNVVRINDVDGYIDYTIRVVNSRKEYDIEEKKIRKRNIYSIGDKVFARYKGKLFGGTIMKVNSDDSYNIQLEIDNNIYKFYGQNIVPEEPICKDYRPCGWNILTRRNPETRNLENCYENRYTGERQFTDPRNDEGIIRAGSYVCENPDINEMIEVRRPFGEGQDCNNYYVIKPEYIKRYEYFMGRDDFLNGLYDKETACRIAGMIYNTLDRFAQSKSKKRHTKKKRKPKKNKSKNIKKRNKSKNTRKRKKKD